MESEMTEIYRLTIIRAEVEKGGVIVAEVETIGPAAKREPTTTKRRSK